MLSISFWRSLLNFVSSSASYYWEDCRFTLVLFARNPRSASVKADVSVASEIFGASTTSSISGLLGYDYCLTIDVAFMTDSLISLASSTGG